MTLATNHREAWARSLVQHMHEAGLSGSDLQRQLEARGVNVTRQTISYWRRGNWSPRPQHQAAIAGVLGKTVAEVFPLEAA